MNPYAALIEKEEEKLQLLRKKVAACEQLIAALRGTDTDDIDAAISKQIGQKAIAMEAPLEKITSQRTPSVAGLRVRSDSVTPWVLHYLGAEGKTLDEIEAHMISVGKPVSRGSLRTMLMNLRVNNEFVENPSSGFYKLSEKGLNAIS